MSINVNIYFKRGIYLGSHTRYFLFLRQWYLVFKVILLPSLLIVLTLVRLQIFVFCFLSSKLFWVEYFPWSLHPPGYILLLFVPHHQWFLHGMCLVLLSSRSLGLDLYLMHFWILHLIVTVTIFVCSILLRCFWWNVVLLLLNQNHMLNLISLLRELPLQFCKTWCCISQ